MKLLFDASSLLEMIKSFDDEKTLRALRENCILDLTKYEVGNALWREHVLSQSIEKDEFQEFLDLLRIVVIRVKGLAAKPENLTDIALTAAEERITFYDASYITIAKTQDLTLITEDQQLAKVASKHAKTAGIKDIASR